MTRSTMQVSVEQHMHGSHGRLISNLESYMIAYVRFLPPSLTQHVVQMEEAGAKSMNAALAYAVGFSSGWMYTEVEWIVSAMVLIGGGGIRKEALSFGSGRGAYSSFHVGYIRQTETEGWKN